MARAKKASAKRPSRRPKAKRAKVKMAAKRRAAPRSKAVRPKKAKKVPSKSRRRPAPAKPRARKATRRHRTPEIRIERYEDRDVIAAEAHRGQREQLDRRDDGAYAERRRYAEGKPNGAFRSEQRGRVDDHGWGRSEGHGRNRLAGKSDFAADDDELNYGRYLGPRDRIPGGGSRRNR